MMTRNEIERAQRYNCAESLIGEFLFNYKNLVFTLEEIIVGTADMSDPEEPVPTLSVSRAKNAIDHLLWTKQADKFYYKGRTYYGYAEEKR